MGDWKWKWSWKTLELIIMQLFINKKGGKKRISINIDKSRKWNNIINNLCNLKRNQHHSIMVNNNLSICKSNLIIIFPLHAITDNSNSNILASLSFFNSHNLIINRILLWSTRLCLFRYSSHLIWHNLGRTYV